MKRYFFFLAAIVLVLVLAGCGPADTLFPLFVKGEKEFDKRLLGEWRFQGEDSFKHGENRDAWSSGRALTAPSIK